MSARIYYIVCSMTWSVLSSFHYIFDAELDIQAEGRLQTWSSAKEDLANWLMDELAATLENEELSTEDLTKLDSVLEAESDKLTYFATNQIRIATDEKKHDELSVDEVVLYHYMCWLSSTLDEVKLLLNDYPVYVRRFSVSKSFLEVSDTIQTEIQKFDQSEYTNITQSGKRYSKKIIQYWKTQFEAIQKIV